MPPRQAKRSAPAKRGAKARSRTAARPRRARTTRAAKPAPRRAAATARRSAAPPSVPPNQVGFLSQHMDYTTHNLEGVKHFYTELLGFSGFRYMPEGPYLAIQTGPMLYGITYIDRPFMAPVKCPRSVAFISSGARQWFVGPA